MELDEQGGLVIVAPSHWSNAHISETLSHNVTQVSRFIASARQRQLKPLRYSDGGSHLYLGKQYPLCIRPANEFKRGVVFADGQIRIGVADPQPHAETIKAHLYTWYQKRAEVVFAERMKTIAARATWLDIAEVSLKLRKMKRTWGNCSVKGVIKLNTHLIKAPQQIIDSVIAHELCHLKEMNHGKVFYTLLESLNPDWKSDRALLRSDADRYLQ